MGILDKDSNQKEKAIRYCIANDVLPYLEVMVNNIREITDVKTVITDIDVLGIEISRKGITRRTLFDCKTINRMSAINRAFWAAGLMLYTGCVESYVILKKKASEAHRVSSKSLNVHLFQEQDFDSYAESSNIDYLNTLAYSSSISNWHKFYLIFEKSPKLKIIGEQLNVKVPLDNDHARALRELIGVIRSNKGEFDPENPEHMSIYFSMILSFIVIMAPISSQIFDIFDKSVTQENYEKILRYYIWGGRESYILRRDLKNAVLSITGSKTGELELPDWNGLIQVSRTFLEEPSELKESLIPCRELSLRCVSLLDGNMDKQLQRKIKKSNRIKQFILASSNYIYKSSGMPSDFHANVINIISDLEEE